MSTGTTATLYLDGVRVADGSPADDPTAPTALAGLAITWGRESTVDQPGPATCQVQLVDSPGGPGFADAVQIGSDLRVTATAPTAPATTVVVFAGRVSNVRASYDDAAAAPLLDITAVDSRADLENLLIGDTPWPAETLTARVDRIMALCAAAGLTLTASIDPGQLAARSISWRDIDRQGAGALLDELAASTDAVLWAATRASTGPFLRFEDQSTRAPGLELALVGAVVMITDTATGQLVLSACLTPRDPVELVQDVSDIVTRVTLSWQDQTGVPAEAPTEQTVTLEDPGRARGVRAFSMGTQLAALADAQAVAGSILARTGAGWRVAGLHVDDDDTDPADDPATGALTPATLVALLDSAGRPGKPLRLVDLPAWTPDPAGVARVFLEGGTYTFAGLWALDLVVSSQVGQGSSVLWDQLAPAWAWDAFDHPIRWDDLRGVGP